MKEKKQKKTIHTEVRLVQGKQCTLEYLLTRKSVKNINVRVKPDGNILVSANKSIPSTVIDNLIKEKEQFILNAFKKYQGYSSNKKKELSICEDGEKCYLLGKSLTLKIVEGNKGSVVRGNDEIIVTVKDKNDESRKEKLWNTWKRKLEEQVFMDICKKIYPLFQPYNIEFPTINIRTMKTMWGLVAQAEA